MPVAITRPVSSSITRCELTHVDRRSIDLELARRQHAAYEEALREAGCTIAPLPEAPELPDAVFVEDLAVVLPELAIVTRPGAKSRRPEAASVEEVLRQYRRRVVRIESPATVDGGDVLCREATLFVGRSKRTNAAGIARLRELVGPIGYAVVEVAVYGCLHLKSAVTALPDRRMLIQPGWIDVEPFGDVPRIEVHPDEPSGANVLSVGRQAVYSASHPRTTERLREAGYDVRSVEMSEMEKAEGAVTCCSVVVG